LQFISDRTKSPRLIRNSFGLLGVSLCLNTFEGASIGRGENTGQNLTAHVLTIRTSNKNIPETISLHSPKQIRYLK